MIDEINQLLESLGRLSRLPVPRGDSLGVGDVATRAKACEQVVSEILVYLQQISRLQFPGQVEEDGPRADVESFDTAFVGVGPGLQGMSTESTSSLSATREMEDVAETLPTLRWFEVQGDSTIPTWASGWNTVTKCHEQTTKDGGTDVDTTDTDVLVLCDVDLQMRPNLDATGAVPTSMLGCLDDGAGNMVAVAGTFPTKNYPAS